MGGDTLTGRKPKAMQGKSGMYFGVRKSGRTFQSQFPFLKALVLIIGTLRSLA
jgi:hypothetical protein